MMRFHGFMALFLVFLFLSPTAFALANPAAVYCDELNKEFGGYSYVLQSDADSNEYGVCVLPDGTQCTEWDFIKGKCGKSHSYCAKKGYDTKTVKEGTREYADCVVPGASSRSGLGASSAPEEIPVVELMNLTEKLGGSMPLLGDSGSSSPLGSEEPAPVGSTYNASDYPSWDWRSPPAGTIYAASNYPYFDDSMGWMTSVKNQQSCGSCWSFGTLGAVEAKYNIITNESRLNPDLSEQNEVSCDHSCYPPPFSATCQIGCTGGRPDLALNNIQNNGVVDEGCFPYQNRDAACSDICSDSSNRLWFLSGYQQNASISDNELKQLLINNGPIVVEVNADAWHPYSGGVLTCVGPSLSVNHAAILIGYDDAGGYWIVKNSWGSLWGENGYIRVKYGCSGVGFAVEYPANVIPPTFGPTVSISAPTEDVFVTDGPLFPLAFDFIVNNRVSTTSACDLLVNGSVVNTTIATNASATTMSHSLPFGTYAWSIRCWEPGLGIIGSSPERPLAILPYLSLQSPANITYHTPSIGLNFTALNQSGCWYSLDGGPDTAIPSCGNATLPRLAEGAHALTVYSNDTLGGQRSVSVSFSVVADPPDVTVLSPANATYNSSLIRLDFSAADADWGLDSCWYILDGGPEVPAACAGASADFMLIDCAHSASAYANNTAGKTGSSTVQFTVRNGIVINVTTQNQLWARSPYNSLRFGLVYSGFPAANCSLKNSSGRTVASMTARYNSTYYFTAIIPYSNGLYPFTLVCSNPALPVFNDTETINISYDTTAPRVVVSSGRWSNSTNVSVSYNVTDNLADRVACTLMSGAIRRAANVTSGATQTENVSLSYQGLNYLSVQCRDYAGNMAFASGTVGLDSTAPRLMVTYISPAYQPNADGTKNTTVYYYVMETSAMNSTAYSIDGTLNGSLGISKYGSLKAALLPGNHTIRFDSYDLLMNHGVADKNFTVR